MPIELKSLAAAALMFAALNSPSHAEDAPAAPPTPAAPPADTTQGDTRPAPSDVPRPSITAKSTDTTAPDAAGEPAPRHRRHYAHRYYRHYAFWEPFPIYLPHLYHNRIVWNRVFWFHF
ncbi:MAG: hypothetical protein JOZ74_15110 [Bradyrhizobium sp.]|nr:hypothetical protein [Bradyrhizobium sp.]